MAPEILSAIWLAAGVTERDLFGGPEAGKESEFVIVTPRLAPVSMKGCDQHLGVLNAEGIDRRSILLADSGAFERGGWIDSLGIVEVSKVERPSQGADRVVVDFLIAGVRIGGFLQASVPRKLVGEAERASLDLRFDASQVGTCRLEVGLVGTPGECRAETQVVVCRGARENH